MSTALLSPPGALVAKRAQLTWGCWLSSFLRFALGRLIVNFLSFPAWGPNCQPCSIPTGAAGCRPSSALRWGWAHRCQHASFCPLGGLVVNHPLFERRLPGVELGPFPVGAAGCGGLSIFRRDRSLLTLFPFPVRRLVLNRPRFPLKLLVGNLLPSSIGAAGCRQSRVFRCGALVSTSSAFRLGPRCQPFSVSTRAAGC